MTPSPSDISRASVTLSKGLAIGYRSIIATVTEDIPLHNGTHYLLARNGRGKTTLLKTLAGLLNQRSGQYTTHGRCQFIGDEFYFDRELKSKAIFKVLIPEAHREVALQLADQLELDINKNFGKLSFGNRKKVGLIVAEFRILKEGPNIVFYDEPFTGLDTPARETIAEHWLSTSEYTLRIVSCHPDFDSMAMPSALLISDAQIFRGGDGNLTWADFKKCLS